MSPAQLPIDEAQWKRIGRRWFTVLFVLICINLSLIVLGINSRFGRASGTVTSVPVSDGHLEMAVEDPAIATSDRQTTGTTELNVLPFTQDDGAQATSSTVTNDATSQSSLAQGPSESAERNQTVVPVVVAPILLDKATTSQTTGSDLSKPFPNAPVTANGVEPNTADEAAASLTIINPSATRGVIHYLIEDEIYSLSPGEYHRLEGGVERRIEFHRGDDLDDTVSVLSTGFFVFSVDEHGWQLMQSAEATGQRLMRSCRSLEPKK